MSPQAHGFVVEKTPPCWEVPGVSQYRRGGHFARMIFGVHAIESQPDDLWVGCVLLRTETAGRRRRNDFLRNSAGRASHLLWCPPLALSGIPVFWRCTHCLSF